MKKDDDDGNDDEDDDYHLFRELSRDIFQLQRFILLNSKLFLKYWVHFP